MNNIDYIFQSDSTYYSHPIENNIIVSVIFFFCIILLAISVIYKKKRLSLIIIALISLMWISEIFNDSPVTLKKVFDNKLYFTVEGNISNFHSIPIEGHDSERFDVDNVHFEISYTRGYPQSKTKYYTLTKNRRGPITHNGQYVKIYYIKPDIATLCIPFTSRCLKFNIERDNKIIKMWVYK